MASSAIKLTPAVNVFDVDVNVNSNSNSNSNSDTTRGLLEGMTHPRVHAE
jgi:hypothetical protein